MALTAQQNIWTGRVAVSRGLSAGDFLGSSRRINPPINEITAASANRLRESKIL
jgi:hypothetical protein